MASKQSCKGRKKTLGLVSIFIRVQNKEEELDGDFDEGQRDFLIENEWYRLSKSKTKRIYWL